MSLTTEPMKDLFSSLPSWARHSISLTLLGGIMVTLFFIFLQQPLANAATADARQDKIAQQQQSVIERLQETVAVLSQTQAVQTNTIANIQRAQDRTDKSLDRIEDKIDHMRQGR